MKIVYLCAKHPPYDGRIHYKICPSLINKGYEIVNIHPNIEPSMDNGIKLLGFEQKGSIKGRIKSLRALYQLAQNQDPEIVFAPEPDSLVIAYLLKRKNKKIKVIFDCHEWYNVHFTHVVRMKNTILAKLLNKLVSFIMHFISKRIDAVISVNDTMAEYFRKYNSNSYSIPSVMTFEKTSICEAPRKDFIYFGQFGNGNQEQVLLDAANVLKNRKSSARIVVIGGYHPNDSSKRDKFQKLIQDDQLQNNLQLCSWLSREESFSMLNQGLVGIMRFDTAYYNGLPALPNKIFEYMSCGMAVICCGLNVELKKIVEKERCGIVIEKECGLDLAEAILYLHENRDICLEMGRNSHNATLIRYNWDNYGNVLDMIIKNISEIKTHK